MQGMEELMSEQSDVDWLVEGVLPAAGRVLLYADSGVGKSFTALDIALHVAMGRPWQGHAVKQGPVYYLAAENPDMFYGRVQAWEKHHKGAAHWEKSNPGVKVPFWLDPSPLDLSAPGAMDALLAKLGPAHLVVIDTLLTALGSWDVKDTSKSYSALDQVNRIIAHTGATVLLVHHKPDQGTHPMGGSAWRGGTQTRIYLTRQRGGRNVGEDGDFHDGDTITLKCQKMSGAPRFPDVVIPVRLVKLKRGLSVPVLASEKVKGRPRRVHLTSATPRVLRLVKDAPTRSAHAERQARYRERAKLAKVTPSDAVTPQSDAV